MRRVDSKYVCSYTPQQAGAYAVRVDYGGKAVRRSPFAVAVRPELVSGASAAWERIRAFGPGLHGGYVNYPATFTLDTGAQKVLFSLFAIARLSCVFTSSPCFTSQFSRSRTYSDYALRVAVYCTLTFELL